MNRVIKLLFLAFVFLFPFSAFAAEKGNVTLYFFHGDGCPHCAEEKVFLDKLQGSCPYLEIKTYEVWYDDENASFLQDVKKAYGVDNSYVPTTVVGNTILVGYSDAIGNKISRAVEYYHENEYVDIVSQVKDGTWNSDEKINDDFDKEEKKSDEDLTVDVPIAGKYNLKNFSLVSAAALLGLIDGFNPCAMWILLFLISVLIGMKNRKRMWALGLAFLITSAVVYMFIMLSWITVAVKATTIDWVRDIIAIIAIVGAGLNLKSFFYSKDSGCDVVDEKKRKKIFKKIRQFTSEKSFILALLGVMGLAVSVNLVELACSAGLPLVFTELLAINDVNSTMRFLYALVYIFFFLIDDLFVFFVAMFTMKVTGISTKYSKYSHLIGGILMLLIGILLVCKPEWLMFNFS